jgi:hypothetical protein
MVANYLQGAINQANQSKNPLTSIFGPKAPNVFSFTRPSTARPVLPSPGDPGNSVGYPGAWSTSTRPSVAADAGMPDFLAQSAAALRGVDYGASEAQLQENAAVARARVASLYKALQRERRDAESIYQGYRDTAEESIGASADQASADIAAGYESALQNQADEMAALGLADTLAQSATSNMAEDQGYNMGTSARLGNAYQNANTLGGAADLAYNQGMIGSAGFASAEGQAQIDQQLSNLLANLAMREQEANAQLPMQQLQYAQGLQGLYQSQQPVGLSAEQQLASERFLADQLATQAETYWARVRDYEAAGRTSEEAKQLAAQDMKDAETAGLYYSR